MAGFDVLYDMVAGGDGRIAVFFAKPVLIKIVGSLLGALRFDFRVVRVMLCPEKAAVSYPFR